MPISAFLLPLAAAFILLSLYFPRTASLQLGIIVAFASLYISFSLIGHCRDKSLTPQIALEYILVATLVVIMIAGVSI